MSRALATFTVSHNRLRLRVRLLACVRDVHQEFHGVCGRWRGRYVHGFFVAAGSGTHLGTVVLAANARLTEIVPHEVTHAAMHWLRDVAHEADESLATAVGILTARILARIRALGYAI